MRKLVLFIFVAICSMTYSQNHFSGAWYVDVAGLYSDQKAIEPALGAGLNLNDRWSLNGRYSFSTPNHVDRYRFFEHNLDIYAKYSVYSMDYIAINLMAGVSQSYNLYSEIPRPTFTPKTYNLGYVAGAELEYFISNNLALFTAVNNRCYFLDEKHLELTYQVGLRIDFSIFTKETYRPKRQ